MVVRLFDVEETSEVLKTSEVFINYSPAIEGGINTVSITWILPFDAKMLAVVTFELSFK